MMILMSLFIIVVIFIVSPFLYMALSRIFSDELFSYKKSLILCFQLLFVTLFFEAIQGAISLYLPSLSSVSNIILTLASIFIVIYIIKLKFEITVLKAIFIQIITITFTIIIAFSFRYFVCQAYKLPAGSNIPTLLVGDHVLVNKYIYRFNPQQRFDVVVFKFPQDERLDYVKRIVALPGEEVQIADKKLFVNGKLVDEKYVMFQDNKILTIGKGGLRDNFGPVTVPEDSFFVLGDNRDNSFDSRFWGFVKKDKIKGKVDVIYYSYDKDSKAVRTDRIGMKIK